MRFALGYPLRPDWHEPIPDLIADYRDHVAELFFAWPGDPSGRPTFENDDRGRRELCQQVLHDLHATRAMGVKTDLLFNSACYAGQAIGRGLERHVRDVMERIGGADVVTTTSPAVAHVIRQHHPNVEIRASVNMRLGTVQAMSHLEDLFDSFYIQRDVQRNLNHVRRLKRWADSRGKRLGMLANSGCLRFCAAQAFHDNMIAHADEVRCAPPIDGFEPLACRRVLARGRWAAILQATWVRPEDLHHYDRLVDVAKLATRTHDSPRLVLDAYARGRFHGNLLDLLEPGYAPLLAPRALANDRLPDDWFRRTSTCHAHCETCDYCEHALHRAIIDYADLATHDPVDRAGNPAPAAGNPPECADKSVLSDAITSLQQLR